MDGYVYDIRDDLGGSYRRMVMVVPGHVTDGDGGAGIGTRDPPICADVGWMPIKSLAVQIWRFCASTGRSIWSVRS
jgi:hypothetical protein